MSIRLSGLVSGMDTDSMVKELVKAYSTKKDDLVKAQTKLSWTQDAWKSVNTKIYSFYGKTLSNMRFSTSYNSKSTSVSDTSKASVIAGDGAVSGSQSLAVKQLAKAGYLTGGKITTKVSGDSITPTANTTLADIGVTADSTFTLTSGGKNYTIDLKTTSKLSDIATQLSDAGVGASYDATNQRFFINAKTTGKDSDFSLTADSLTAISSMTAIGIYTGSDVTQNPAYTTWANYVGATDEDTISNMSDIIATEVAKRIAANQTIIDNANSIIDTNNTYLTNCGSDSNVLYQAAENKLTDPVTLLNDYGIAADSTLSDSEKIAVILTKDLADANATGSTATAEEKAALVTAVSLATNIVNANTNITNANASIDTAQDNIDSAEGNVKTEYLEKANTAYEIVNGTAGSTGASTAVRINGQDGEIFLNGAQFTSTSNTFSINGLTITAKETTGLKADATADLDDADNYNTVSLTTDMDVSGIYDNIKSFFKEYNTLIKELDSLYGADSAKGFEPLTSDEKDAMTDTEIEDWEKKIKDALLRRDDTLDGVINSMKTAMAETYTIDGSQTSLSTYGINTLSYFLSGDNEKGVYHIDGDSDDTSTSEAADKLKTAIAKDPESVANFFQQLTSGLYTQLSKKMSSTTMRSAYTVYNDKQIKKDYDDYKTKISDQEKKLKNIEDKYYKQFSAMEAAMSKLNSSQSALSGLLGNS
ncbi:MAG: flagellar filament capping protein FliD [Lachnospiraceae bacterium]|nr:flagellar filament capping protein FliD [Lachnospiraceae bacterium]